MRERLYLVWTDPMALDPARRAAKVTREIADMLAVLAKSLESAGHAPRQRCDLPHVLIVHDVFQGCGPAAPG